MKAQPPFLSDTEADEAWHQGNDRMLGDRCLTDEMIQQQINVLQDILAQRTKPALTEPVDRASQRREPSAKGLAQRVFRQGVRSAISDKNQEKVTNQPKSRNMQFSGVLDVPGPKKLQPDQSASSGQSVSLSVPLENDISDRGTGRKRSTVHKPCDYETAGLVLAPYDHATLKGQESRARALKSLAKRDRQEQLQPGKETQAQQRLWR